MGVSVEFAKGMGSQVELISIRRHKVSVKLCKASRDYIHVLLGVGVLFGLVLYMC